MTARMPDWLEPMAATLTQERFTGPEWMFERKFDGIRLLAFKHGDDVRLFSRNRLPQNTARPSPRRSRALPVDDVDPRRRGRPGTAASALPRLRHPVARRARRRRRCRSRSAARCSQALPLRAAAAARRARSTTPSRGSAPAREGWEGVIAKRRDSPYEHRRSPHWLKMKCEASQELVVGGFTDPQGARVGLGALLVGYFDGDDFVFAGKVGTGFDTQAAARAARAARRASRSRRRRSPRRRAAAAARALGAPGDRRAGRVHRVDRARQAAPSAAARRPHRQGGARGRAGDVVITHPEKVLFPDDGITKGELAAYYEAIAPVMLPHLRGRPVTMERYPAGIGEKGFLQKDVSKGFPDVARARRGAEEGRHRAPSARHDTRSLLWIDQPEHHHASTSGRRACPTSIYPDICVFDLDPSGGRSRRRCAPRRSRCAICSTSSACRAGSRHPARRASTSSCRSTARRTIDDGGALRARASGALLVAARPEHLTQEFSKADRGGRIFVDTGRNGYSATFAAAYAVRAKPGAPVSAPCTWEEVERGDVRPADVHAAEHARAHRGGRRPVGRHAAPRAIAPAAAREAAQADRRRAGNGGAVSRPASNPKRQTPGWRRIARDRGV